MTDSEAAARGVERSLFRFPWDPDYGVYYIKSFHNLHCLVRLLAAIVERVRLISR